jgi:glycosyltransferase involved in cell wall biosynthesis
MDHIPDASLIYNKLQQPVLTLLFLAVEWERKGGAIALDAFYKIKKSGQPVKLIICGCRPSFEIQDADVEVVPFLNKNQPADHKRFVDILSTIHFLVLPTRADCSLLVACEASSYGVPSISTATGGVPDIVKDGVNGYCLPYDAGADKYAALIQEIYSDKERYKRMILSSRQRFEDVLNWDKWAESFRTIYEEKIRSSK